MFHSVQWPFLLNTLISLSGFVYVHFSFLLQFNEDCDLLVFEVKEASDKVVLYLHFFVISMDVLSIFLHRDASSRQFGKNMELTHLSIEDDI